MLLLEPLWVYASVGICIASGRKYLEKVEDIWGNKYLTTILLMISCFFVPVESWILQRHTEWETTFTYPKVSNLEKDKDKTGLLAVSTLMHMLITVVAYYTCMMALKKYGHEAVIKLSMWSFSIFFASQGIFYDTLMYAGSYSEFHNGVQKSLTDFILSETFRDAYLIFFCLFGPAFYGVLVSWGSGYTKQEKFDFIKQLIGEANAHGVLIYSSYFLIALTGVLGPNYTVSRLGVVIFMHSIPHILVIAPLLLATTKEAQD